jgi:site-specific recombinase XerD
MVHDRMQDDLKLKGYATATAREYLRLAEKFVAHIGRSPLKVSEATIREYVLELAKSKRPPTVKMHVASIRFLYEVTLRRPQLVASLHWPKVPHHLPDILSLEETRWLLDAVESPKHRVILMATYGAGLRIGEACRLMTTDIDSQRGLIHIRQGKRGRDRYVMLSPVLLAALRAYWKQFRPVPPILFPGDAPGSCVTQESVRDALRQAVAKAGITKRVTPHVLRHAFATHLLEAGADIRTIQMLLGHNSIRSTARYTQVSTAHIAKVLSPLDRLAVHESTAPR